MGKISRSLIIGACMIAPGGLIALTALAVVDKGCGSIVIVFLLTLCGWVPGVIAALIILNNPDRGW